jgi:hypothetical protein
LYRDVSELVAARLTSHPVDPLALDFPNAEDGLEGMMFVDAAIRSRAEGGAFVSFAEDPTA